MSRYTIIAALLRLYPRGWRKEYGAELSDMLLAAPLTVHTVADVLWSGVGHRLRATEPWVYLGLLGFVWIWQDWPLMRFYWFKLQVLYAICGIWMELRHWQPRYEDAGVRLTLLASPPLVIQTILAIAGYVPPVRNWIFDHAPLTILLIPFGMALTAASSVRTGAWLARWMLRPTSR